MKRVLATASAALMMLAAPSIAAAVNVSSGEGSGTQTMSRWYACGGTATGKLKSTNGNPVYYNADGVYDGDVDAPYGRYTSDTSSTSLVTRGGNLGSPSGGCTNKSDGMHFKVCRNRNNVPDPCGGWSSTIRRP